MPSKIVFGVLGDAPVKREIIEDSLNDWINDLADKVDDAESTQTVAYLPASRTHTTPAVRVIAEWVSEDPDAKIVPIAATSPGVHGKDLISKGDEPITVAAAEIDEEMVARLRVHAKKTDNHVYLILLQEPDDENPDLDELAEDAAASGITVAALHATGMDRLVPDGEETDEESAEADAPEEEPHQVTIEEAIAESDEAQADLPQKFAVAVVADGKGVSTHMADLAEALYLVIDHIVRDAVERALKERALKERANSPLTIEAFAKDIQVADTIDATDTLADEPETKPRRRGRPRTGAADEIEVLKKPDGTYAPMQRGRRPAGSEKVKISRKRAEELGLA